MGVKTFADTSVVKLALQNSNYATYEEWLLTHENHTNKTNFTTIPYTTESFKASKETKMSTAITGNRRQSGSRNIKGSASGGFTIEASLNSTLLSYLIPAALMNDFVDVTTTDDKQIRVITDGATISPMLVEKYEKTVVDGKTYHEFSQFFGTCVNELSFDFGAADFVKVSATTMSTDFNLNSSVISGNTEDNLASSLAAGYTVVTPDDLLDTTNSIKSIKLFGEDGIEIKAVFSTASLKITNNLREQSALGYEFMAGIGAGKVNVTITGEIYFYNNEIFRKHLDNDKISAIIELEDSNEVLEIHLPKLTVAAPTNNSQGENQDYKTSISFNAEEGSIAVGDGTTKNCVVAMKYYSK